MALVVRLIPSITGSDPRSTPYKPTNASTRKEKILQASTHSSMVGILAQMAWLADYAHEVFTGLNEEARSTYTRMTNLSQQLTKIDQAIPRYEKMVEQKPMSYFFNNPRAEFALPVVSDAQVFTAESQSKSVKELYAAAKPPPQLSRMDKYMDPGKKCLENYTNPKFFLDEWIAEQIKIRQAAKEARRKRREEGKLKAAADPKARTQLGAAQPKKIVKTVFNPVTGEKMTVQYNEGERAPTAASVPTSTMSQSNRLPASQSFASISHAAPPMAKFDDAPALPTDEFMPPPPPPVRSPSSETPGSFIGNTPAKTATPEVPRAFQPPPPPVYNTPTPMPVATPTPQPTYAPAPAAPAPPPPPQYVEAPPPNSQLEKGAPAPPPLMSSSSSGKLGGGLLSDLQSASGGLKHAVTNAPKAADGRTNLMEGIRKGIALKSAGDRQIAKVEESGPQSVADILSRRIAIIGDSDDDDDDDEDDAWA